MPRRNGRMRNKAPAPHRKRQARWPSESPTRFGNPTGWILRNFPRRHVDGAGWGCTTAGAAEDQRRSGEIRRRGLVYRKHQFFAQPDPQQEQFPTPWFLRCSNGRATAPAATSRPRAFLILPRRSEGKNGFSAKYQPWVSASVWAAG